VHTADGLRTGFPRTVAPGDRVLVPVDVCAPPEPGEYVLEVDLVHERVRWFERGCAVPVTVGLANGLPPEGVRLAATRSRRARRLRRARIPRVIHRAWLGGAEIPAAFVGFGETFEHHHPGWKMRLWTDADLPFLGITDSERSRARTESELSNVVRYEALHRFGGVYVDTDVECRRSFAGLLRGVTAFAGMETPGRVGTAVIGAVAGHRLFERAARLSRLTLGQGRHSPDANGPYFLSLLVEQEPGVTIFDAGTFYPYLWTEPERRNDPFPDAYAVHHWAKSWGAGES
jgi:hypothetical protein